MFNVTGGELVIILLVALIVLGPDKLPDAIRKVGRVYGEVRRMSQGFQSEIRDALDEPMREVRDTMNTMKGGFMGGDADPPGGTRLTADPEPKPADDGTVAAEPEPEPAREAEPAVAAEPAPEPAPVAEPVDDFEPYPAVGTPPEPYPAVATEPVNGNGNGNGNGGPATGDHTGAAAETERT